MASALDEMIQKLQGMETQQFEQIAEEVMKETEGQIWVPSPGPQTEAYYSEADVLLYGGEPGGGKSSLLLGLALTQHHRSLIMRRQYTDLGHLTEEALRFNNGKRGWNGSPPPKLKRPDGRIVDFGAAAQVGDEQHWMGNPHDLIGFDEATQFAKQQILFLMGWLRSTKEGQRKRVVLATNPPLEAEGLWVNEMFAPWLDERFVNPAKPGELRWAIMDDEDRLKWVEGPSPVHYDGRLVEPKSYTYIPSSMRDNPFLRDTDYQKNLDNLTGEVRKILMGGFQTTFRDQPLQVIPTEWVRLAQERWRPAPPDGVPMCAMGVDCTGGGVDPIVISPRYDAWFAPQIEIPGKEVDPTRIGSITASHIVTHRMDDADVIIDMGGGYGQATYEILDRNKLPLKAYKGAEGTHLRTRDKKMSFTNVRTAALWRFRELLDPEQPGGSPARIPPSRQIIADLTAPTYKITPNGYQAESKEAVCQKLGRSTNWGDSIMMSWFFGAKEENSALKWAEQQQRRSRGRGQAPRVITSRPLRTGRS